MKLLPNRFFERKSTGVLSQGDLKKASTQTAYIMIFLLMAVCSCVALLPILWVMLSGFKDIKEFASINPSFFPKHINLMKVAYVWKKLNFLKYYRNSVVIAAGSCLSCVLVTGMMGYALSKMKAAGTKLVFAVVLWSMLIPGSLGMVPTFMTFLDFPVIHVNITNTYLPMWITAGTSAFNMLLFKSHFDSIPTAYVEAAKLDGCSALGIFLRIMIPLSMPVVMVVTIFQFNGAWESFLWPYLTLKNEAMQPVAVAIYELRSNSITADEYMIALFLSIIPPFMMFLFFHKNIMKGINIGGIKG